MEVRTRVECWLLTGREYIEMWHRSRTYKRFYPNAQCSMGGQHQDGKLFDLISSDHWYSHQPGIDLVAISAETQMKSIHNCNMFKRLHIQQLRHLTQARSKKCGYTTLLLERFFRGGRAIVSVGHMLFAPLPHGRSEKRTPCVNCQPSPMSPWTSSDRLE